MKKFKGELEGVQEAIVNQMLDEQERQGNKRDVTIFENCIGAKKSQGGFNWGESLSGWDYWEFIISLKYYKYLSTFPTTSTYEPLDEKVMLVSDDNRNWRKRVVFGKKNGGFLAWGGAETIEEALICSSAISWKYAKEIEEPKEVILTMEEVAKLAGCKVENLKIQI